MPTAKAAGLSEDQISEIESGSLVQGKWSEKDKALLNFLDAVISGPEVSDETFCTAREYFSDQALVEVVIIQVREILFVEQQTLPV